MASFKFNFGVAAMSAGLTIAPNDLGCAPYIMVFNNTSVSATNFEWNFDDGSPISTQTSPVHTFQNPGTYNVRLVAFRPNSCIGNDTA